MHSCSRRQRAGSETAARRVENTSHLPQQLGGSNEKVPLIPPKCLQMPRPPPSKLKSRAALRHTLLPAHQGPSIAVSDCSAGQGGNVHSFSPDSLQGIHDSPLPPYFPSSLICTHHSSTWTKMQGAQLPTCRNPPVSAASSATGLSPAWEQRTSSPIHK